MAIVVNEAFLTALGATHSGKADMPPSALVAAAIQMLTAGVALLVAAAAFGQLHTGAIAGASAESVGALAYLVLAGSLLAYSAFVWLLHNASVSTVATYAYVNPIVAVALGALFLRERVTLSMMIAAAVIVASVFLVVRESEP